MQRMIRKVHTGLLTGKSLVGNTICMESSRLIANCSIAYNAMLLSNVYLSLVERLGEEKAREIMNRISPVAWQHINFTGKYKFMAKDYTPDIDAISKFLEIQLASYLEGNKFKKKGKNGGLSK